MEKEKMTRWWEWYKSLGNGGYAGVGDEGGENIEIEEENTPEPSETTPDEPETEKIGGVEYTRDEEGRYCVGDTPVLDANKKPFHNLAHEIKRKTEEFYQRQSDSDRRHQEELTRIKADTPPPDPDEIDEVTQLTNRQLQALDSRNRRAVDEAEFRSLRVATINHINQEKMDLKQDDDYKDFFGNTDYVREMDDILSGLNLSVASSPGVIKRVVASVRGSHIKEILKDAINKGRKAANEQREILGEVQLGSSAGINKGKSIRITDEIRDCARETGLPIEDAAEVIEFRRSNASKKKQGGDQYGI